MAKVIRGIVPLFGGRQLPPLGKHESNPRDPFSIPPPPGMPAVLLDRVTTQQPRPPHRKGKRRTPEEIAADRAALTAGMKSQAVQRLECERARVEAIGVTHYRWRSAGDADVCKVCAKRDGKAFPYRSEANFQHPGLVECCGDDACRCYAEPIIPD